MKNKKLLIIPFVIFTIFIGGLCSYEFYIKDINTDERKIKVGFYEYYPYYYINNRGSYSGYYNDLMKLISKNLNVNFEYINCYDVPNGLKMLENGEINLLFGVNKSKEREEKFLYTNQYIGNENCEIYTNKDIPYGAIQDLNGLNMGYIKGDESNEWILNLFKDKGINVNLVYANSYNELKGFLYESKVDFIVYNKESKLNLENRKVKSILDFSTGPVYIVSNKNNKKVINLIDKVLSENSHSNFRKDKNLYNKYFNQYKKVLSKRNLLIFIFILILGAIIGKRIKLKIFFRRNKKNILNDLNKGNFILYYQPIVDPKKNLIVGFEALLRLRRNGQILTPYYFLNDIEKSNLMSEVSLSSFKKVISDYKVISNYNNLKNKKIYVSFNLSFKEIEDSNFLNKLIEIAVNNNMPNNSICLEIVEKFTLEDIDKIKKSLEILRLHGFLIAIDDFGVEYSNLDLLDKIDYDIIKLDKYFIDNINSETNKKIIDFLSQICKVSNKKIVFEGIEEKYQFDIIRSLSYEKMYIQGYYFSKPVDIEMLKKLKL